MLSLVPWRRPPQCLNPALPGKQRQCVALHKKIVEGRSPEKMLPLALEEIVKSIAWAEPD
jgi:hypothetical protein